MISLSLKKHHRKSLTYSCPTLGGMRGKSCETDISTVESLGFNGILTAMPGIVLEGHYALYILYRCNENFGISIQDPYRLLERPVLLAE